MTAIKLHPVTQTPANVEPGVRFRKWMEPHAYRCLPLAAANTYGWDVLAPDDIRAKLNEKGEPEIISGPAYTHFGMQTITVEQGYVWKTEPSSHLMVVPVPNQDCVGWYPLSAVMETDILNYPWFLSLRLTGGEIHIPKGTPLCRVVPVSMDVVAQATIAIEPEPKDVLVERMELHRQRDELKDKNSWIRFYQDRAKYRALRASTVVKMVPGDGPTAMLAMHGVHFVPDLLTPEECEEVIAMWEKTQVTSDGNTFWNERSRYPVLTPGNLTNKLTRAIEGKGHTFYGETLFQRAFNIVRWGEGDEMPAHTDLGQHNEFPNRKYAAVIFLSDQFDGGETYFPTLGAEVRCSRGTAMLFPGGTLMHGVKKITKGLRYTAISWLGLTVPEP